MGLCHFFSFSSRANFIALGRNLHIANVEFRWKFQGVLSFCNLCALRIQTFLLLWETAEVFNSCLPALDLFWTSWILPCIYSLGGSKDLRCLHIRKFSLLASSFLGFHSSISCHLVGSNVGISLLKLLKLWCLLKPCATWELWQKLY